MHRFFFLLMAWILVEAYWLVPMQEKANMDMEELTFSVPNPNLDASECLYYRDLELKQPSK